MFYQDENGELFREDELEEMFIDMLDEVYGEFDLGIVTISASKALREADPIAYRCAFSDYLSEFEEVVAADA